MLCSISFTVDQSETFPEKRRKPRENPCTKPLIAINGRLDLPKHIVKYGMFIKFPSSHHKEPET